MTTKVPDAEPRRPSRAALWIAASTLAGCNVVAALGGVGFSSSSELSVGAATDAPRELSVALRPGLPLLQAAAQAPRAVSALSRAARGLGEVGLLDGKYLRAVSNDLLDEGLLIPGPLGMLEVRLEVLPIPSEPIAVTALVPDRRVAPQGCTEVAVPAALVGAYRAGSRLLLLRTDGRFVLQGSAQASATGSYTLGCKVLQLASEARPPLRFTQHGSDGWTDPNGATFLPLTASPAGVVP